MAASTTDKLTNTASTTTSRPQPTQVTASRSAGVFTLACNSLTGWPTSTDSKVHFCTYKINTAGAKIAGSQIDMDGIVSGTSIGSITIRGGSDVGNAIGDIVEMAPTAAWAYDLYQWGSAHANKDGSLLTAAVQTALGSGSQALNGWNALAFPFNTVTYNGNRNYTCVINSQDVTGTLSPGMRIRTQRTVAAPTQATSLNGTNQYWSKTSPAGMTFTDTFTCMAWVKVTSYQAATIMSRFNGTSGWIFKLETTGQVTIQGLGAGVNQAKTSYQSLPLNKWVHVAATLQMSTGVSTIYFDGALAPNLSGSAVGTALTQAGNLEVGSLNGGLSPFVGKIAQASVWSVVLSQATINGFFHSQSLIGNEGSLVSAYSFNGNGNDLNTTNANNLTANNGATATNADSPFGGQGDGTISSTLDYGIVQKATFSTNTTVVIQVAEGCTIPTSGGVAAVAYSSNKIPYLFPGQRGKWTISSTILAQGSAAATGAYQSVSSFQLNIPAGEWFTGYSGLYQANVNAVAGDLFATLSTSTSAESDKRLTASGTNGTTGAIVTVTTQGITPKSVTTTTNTPYYLLLKALSGTVYIRGDNCDCSIIAENAWL